MQTKINYLYIPVIKNCNKNCNYCCACSPLYDKREYVCSAKEIIQVLTKLENILGYKIDIINIGGGEPLLNNELENIFVKLRKNNNKCLIKLTTNGILLDKMKKSFYQSIGKNNIFIDISFYKNIDIEKYFNIKFILDKYNINFKLNNGKLNISDLDLINNNLYKMFTPCIIDKNGNYDTWKNCKLSMPCYILDVKYNRLYPCDIMSNYNKLVNYFNLDLDIYLNNKKDYINLNDKYVLKEDIEKLYYKRHSLCKYCNSYRDINLYDIDPNIKSLKQKHEWIRD
jgi:organic radical activating enzyme